MRYADMFVKRYADIRASIAGMNGEQLRQERERLGLTQKRLADLLDVRQSTISEWEKRKVTIRHEHILELAMRDVARSLGVEPKELLRDV